MVKATAKSFSALWRDGHVCQTQNARVRDNRRRTLPSPKLGVGAKNRGESRETNNRLVAESCWAIDGGTKLGEINCTLHLTGEIKRPREKERHSSGELRSFVAHSLVPSHKKASVSLLFFYLLCMSDRNHSSSFYWFWNNQVVLETQNAPDSNEEDLHFELKPVGQWTLHALYENILKFSLLNDPGTSYPQQAHIQSYTVTQIVCTLRPDSGEQKRWIDCEWVQACRQKGVEHASF